MDAVLSFSHRKVSLGRFATFKTSVTTFSPLRKRNIIRCSVTPPSSSLAKFKEAAQNDKNLIPLQNVIFSDNLTPVLAYRRLVKEDNDDRRESPSFLFESLSTGCYSVVGAHPTIEIVAKQNQVTIMDHHTGHDKKTTQEDPTVIPRTVMEKWKPQHFDELPDVFTGGWVGYFSYDTVRYAEKEKLPFSNGPLDDRSLPDIHLGLYDEVVVFDHLHQKAHIIHWVQLDRFSSVEEAYNDGMNRLEALVAKVQNISSPELAAESMELHAELQCSSPQKKMSSMSDEEYEKAVSIAKEHILDGDIYQIFLSRRFIRQTFCDPFEVYRALRIVNPSPCMTYLQVSGELFDNLNTWDALRATLPLEIVTGVPKVRAMELIDKLEATSRGPYSGVFGGISFSGDMDLALALTTIIFPTGLRHDAKFSHGSVHKRRNWVAHVEVGTGIVADSNPGDEQIECQNKAAPLFSAIHLAESSFLQN